MLKQYSNILRRGIATATLKQSAAGPSAVSGHEGNELLISLKYYIIQIFLRLGKSYFHH